MLKVHLKNGKVQVQLGETLASCSTLVSGIDGDVVLVEEDLLARSERQRQAQCNLGRFEPVCDRAWDGWKMGGGGREREEDQTRSSDTSGGGPYGCHLSSRTQTR